MNTRSHIQGVALALALVLMSAGTIRGDEEASMPPDEPTPPEVVVVEVPPFMPGMNESPPSEAPPTQVTIPARDPGQTVVPAEATPRPALVRREGITLNFQGAPLIDVLQYLSEMGGFVIIQETPVAGTATVMSHQPLTPDESVDLLNTLLVEKGLVAIRSGRILRIVDRRTALRQPLPVYTSTRPQDIPMRDEMATQIIPVRFANATQLIANLSPLLAEGASMSANESSNSIVITDTQTNARRMAEIIGALDSSIAGISAVRVFPLRFAAATELAKTLQDFFSPTGTSAGQAQTQGPRWAFQRGGAGGPGGSGGTAGDSAARTAASRVTVAAEERTNSLIVSAPENIMATVEEIVREVDATGSADTRPFRLERADALEVAELLRGVFDREVTAVGDPRTNMLLVRASRETLFQVAEMVGRLDASDARTQRVRVIPLEHADAENVAGILRGMFEAPAGTTRTGTIPRTGTAGTAATQGTGRLTDRATRGASTGTTSTLGGQTPTRR